MDSYSYLIPSYRYRYSRHCSFHSLADSYYSLVVAFVNTKTDFPEGIVVDWVGVNYIPMVSSFSFVCFVHSNLQANLHFFPFTSLFSATHQNFLYSTSNFHSKSLTIDTIKRFKIHKSITIIVRSQKSAILQIDHVTY